MVQIGPEGRWYLSRAGTDSWELCSVASVSSRAVDAPRIDHLSYQWEANSLLSSRNAGKQALPGQEEPASAFSKTLSKEVGRGGEPRV